MFSNSPAINYLSIIDKPIVGFKFVDQISAKDLSNTIFVVVIKELSDFSHQFSDTLSSTSGIIVTVDQAFKWLQISPCVWHFTLPSDQLDNLMPLIQGQLAAIYQQNESQQELISRFEKRANRTTNALADLIKFIALQLETGTIKKLRYRVLEFLLNSESFSYKAAALMRFSKKRQKWSIVSKRGDWSHKKNLSDIPHLTEQVSIEESEFYVQQCINNEDYVLLVSKNFDDSYEEIEINFFHLFALMMKVTFETKMLQENITHELTQRKEAQNALSRAVQTRDEFLASMSHELRTPLNAILGQSQLLLMNVYGALTDKQITSIQGISDSGHHLLSLINDILDLSKLEAVEVQLNLSSFKPADLATDCLTFIQAMAGRKQLDIALEADSSFSMVGDERRVKQILLNLLSNAVKFTPVNGKVGLDIEAFPERNSVVFSVWDTGIGIEQSDLQKLFQPFVQVDSKLNRKYNGSGLGLVLVDRLACLHGGSVSVISKPNFGSRFTVELPLKPTASVQESELTEDKKEAGEIRTLFESPTS